MASVRHPNVISYLGVCAEPACIVTEYCSKVCFRAAFTTSVANHWSKHPCTLTDYCSRVHSLPLANNLQPAGRIKYCTSGMPSRLLRICQAVSSNRLTACCAS